MASVLDLFAENVKRLLAERSWSQKDLASRARVVTQSQISQYLRGENTPGLEKVEAIARAFGITSAELIAPPGATFVREVDHGLEVCVAKVSAAALGKTAAVPDEFDPQLEALVREAETAEGEDYDRAVEKLLALLAAREKRRA